MGCRRISPGFPLPNEVLCRLLVALLILAPAAAMGQQELEQKPIVIKGDQALPATLYIAPWKRVSKPLESGMLDGDIVQDTQPVERDLFLRELELRRQGYSIGDPESVQVPIRPATPSTPD